MKFTSSKTTKSHTTTLEAAKPILNFAQRHPLVTKISLGIIQFIPGRGPGKKRIKCHEENACIMVSIRSNRATQEVRLFASNIQKFVEDLKRYAVKEGFEV